VGVAGAGGYTSRNSLNDHLSASRYRSRAVCQSVLEEGSTFSSGKKYGLQWVLPIAGMLLLVVIIALSFHYKDATIDKENRIAQEFLDRYRGKLKEPAMPLGQVDISSNFIVVKEFRSAAFPADSSSCSRQAPLGVSRSGQKTAILPARVRAAVSRGGFTANKEARMAGLD
jgi:hypothetical protein